RIDHRGDRSDLEADLILAKRQGSRRAWSLRGRARMSFAADLDAHRFASRARARRIERRIAFFLARDPLRDVESEQRVAKGETGRAGGSGELRVELGARAFGELSARSGPGRRGFGPRKLE